MRNRERALVAGVIGLALVVLLGGCAAREAFHSARELDLKGDYDGAVMKYMEAVDKDPNRHEYRVRLDEALAAAAWKHLEAGRSLMKERQWDGAAREFRKALEYDKTLVVAEAELGQAEKMLRAERLVEQADDFIRNRRLQQASASLDEALLIDPENARGRELQEKVKATPRTVVDGVELDMSSNRPITLKFKDTDVKDAFNILSKLTGVNFILDADIKKQSFTFELVDVSFPQALELILQTNKLGKKIINAKTILIYSKGKDGEKQFADQVIQTFYLSNIDAKKAVNLLRTMLQLRRVYVHEELNAIVVRDTAEVIKLAGQMLEAADRADAEVTFDLELIEVNHDNKINFGPKLTSGSAQGNQITYSFGEGGAITGLSGLNTYFTLPSLTFDFLKTRNDSEVLANPKIRVKNKEKAKVKIGTREPVVSVTKSGTGTSADYSESIQYLDVGVNLEVEPNIQLDNTVITKLSLEVSSKTKEEKSGNGSSLITLTTTNAQSSLTLRDGERTIIGGLVRDDSSKSRSGLAFVSDLPLIGSLFTSLSNSKSKREILLSITPHIVQKVVVPGREVGTLWSGAEEDLKAGPIFSTFTTFDAVSEAVPPAETKPAAAKAPVAAPVAPAEKSSVPPAAATAPPTTVEPPTAETPPATETPLAPPAAAAVAPTPEVVPPAEPVGSVVLPAFEVPPVGDGALLMQGPKTVKVGDEVVVEVRAKEVSSLYSVPLFVVYDQAIFEQIKAEEGDFLKQGGAQTVFTTSRLAERGEVIVGYKQGVGGTGVSGDGLLFRMTFRAKAPGATQIKLDRLNLRNVAGTRLKIEAPALDLVVR